MTERDSLDAFDHEEEQRPVQRNRSYYRELTPAEDSGLEFHTTIESSHTPGRGYTTEEHRTSYYVAGRRIDKHEDVFGTCAFHKKHDFLRPRDCGPLTEDAATVCDRCRRIACPGHSRSIGEKRFCFRCARWFWTATILKWAALGFIWIPLKFVCQTLLHLFFEFEDEPETGQEEEPD